MKVVSAGRAGAKLDRLVEKVAGNGKPVRIKGRSKCAVLVSEDDWRAIRETLYLLSVSGMRRSIREGIKVPVGNCGKELTWRK